jgi:hypothetical protein
VLCAIALAIMMILGVTAPKADAAASRAEYVAQLQPICLAAEQQAERHLKKVARGFQKAFRRAKKKFGQLPPVEAGEVQLKKKDLRKLLQGFAIVISKILGPQVKAFDGATVQIRAIPAAPGDEAAVSTWLAGRAEFARLNFIAIRAGRHGKLKRLLTFSTKADDVLRSAQTPVNNFGLQSCFIELPVGGPIPFSATATFTNWTR